MRVHILCNLMHITKQSLNKQIAIEVYIATRADVRKYKQEIAARLGVSVGTLRAWIENGRKLSPRLEDAILSEAAEIDAEHSD